MDKEKQLNDDDHRKTRGSIWGKHWERNLGEQRIDDFRRYFKNRVFVEGYPIHKKYILGEGQKEVLEVGGGSGRHGVRIAIDFPLNQVVITDISSESLKLTSQLLEELKLKNVSVRIEDATNLSFPDDSFDLVVCNATLQYIKNYEKAVSEMARVLKPGGRLLLSVINFWNLPTTIQRKLAGRNYVHGYERPFSRGELRDLMRGNKLKIIALDGYALAYGIHRLKYINGNFELLARLVNRGVRIADRLARRLFSKLFGFEILIVGEKER